MLKRPRTKGFAIIYEVESSESNMKKSSRIASLITMVVLGMLCAAPARAEWDPNHPGIVVPAYCDQEGQGANYASWIDVNGHHAISMVTPGDDAEGFVVYGNISAVLHHQVPGGGSGIGAGPIPPGVFTFSVASSTVPNPKFLVYQYSNTGCLLDESEWQAVNGVVSIKIDSPGPACGQIQVFSANDVAARYVVGNFAINGVPLPGAILNANLYSGIGFCGITGSSCD